MDQNLGDERQFRTNDVLNGVGQVMAVSHRHLTIDLQIEINEEVQAQLADEAFVSPLHAGNRSRQSAHFAFDPRIGSTVQNLPEGRTQNGVAVDQDDPRRE